MAKIGGMIVAGMLSFAVGATVFGLASSGMAMPMFAMVPGMLKSILSIGLGVSFGFASFKMFVGQVGKFLPF